MISNHISIRLYMEPPTATAQMHKVRVIKGRPVFYDPPEVRQAKRLFMEQLKGYRPDEPLTGPLKLRTHWMFACGPSHPDSGEWKVTKPDTDNLQKMLKDCMTKSGFWLDDAQVCYEEVYKTYSDTPGLDIQVSRLYDEYAQNRPRFTF